MSVLERLSTLRVNLPALLSHHDDCSLTPCNCGMDGVVANLDRLVQDVSELRNLALEASAACYSTDAKRMPEPSIRKMLQILGRAS